MPEHFMEDCILLAICRQIARVRAHFSERRAFSLPHFLTINNQQLFSSPRYRLPIQIVAKRHANIVHSRVDTIGILSILLCNAGYL